MRKMDSQGRACVVPVAVVAGFGMAGMGLVSSGIVAADTVTDTINVTVQPSCTFNSVEDKTYIGSAANGTEVNNFNDSGVHEFNLFCNDNNGYIVTATAYDLEADGIEDVIAYTDNYTHTGVNSMWTAVIESDTPGLTVTSPVPVGGGTIISSDSSTTAAGADFTATYSAYVGTATPAGTYTGTIVYTLTAAGTSNSGNSGGDSGNSGDSGTGDNSGSGTGTGDNSGGSGTGGDSGSGTGDNSGGSGTGTGGDSGTGGEAQDNSGGSGNEPSNTPSNAPAMLNNTYNSYSTTNNYNTTNYPSGGAGTTGTQVATNGAGNTGDSTNGTTGGSGNNGNGSNTSSGYEQPLGVTTTKASSDNGSEIDWAPIVATGVVLAAAGVGAIALARSNKEDEQEEQ